MPKITYESWTPTGATRVTIDQANTIIGEYAALGFGLTLRQLYYQFVARGLGHNTTKAYKRLGSIISRARKAGLVDWNAIEDRTRQLRRLPTWDHPGEILSACAEQFRLDPWKEQDSHVEVWFEKDALIGVIERTAQRWRIPYFSCRGYTSDSEVWSSAKRLAAIGKPTLVLHLSDHDPSGLDMTADIGKRLQLFGAGAEVRRIALTMAQVEQHGPPPNPAKETDSRYAQYRREYGDESWELDALDPRTLDELIESHVAPLVDAGEWEATLKDEQTIRKGLRLIAKEWRRAIRMLGGKDE